MRQRLILGRSSERLTDPGKMSRSVDDWVATIRAEGSRQTGSPVHPLRLVTDLQAVIDDDVTLCLDVGSSYIWLARYLQVFRPRQMIFPGRPTGSA